jgi:hypothetical protein
MGGEAQEEIRLEIKSEIKMNMERLYANSKSAVDAVASRNWDLVIQEIVGVAKEFRGTMGPFSELPKESRGKYVLRCGREHHPTEGKISTALKKALENKK